MRIFVNQDCAIRTKPWWYHDLLDHIIRLSLTFSTGRCKDAAVAFPKVLAQDTRGQRIDRYFDYASRAIERSISFAGSLSLFRITI